MTYSLPPVPLSSRGDGRFRAILDRADGIHGVAQYHWPAKHAVTVVEAESRSLLTLFPAVSPQTARAAAAMGSGFAASVALVMASGILYRPAVPAPVQEMRALEVAKAEAGPVIGRASAFAVPTLLPMLDTTATLVAELPKPVVTVQRSLAVRSVAVAPIPSTEEPTPVPGPSIALAEPETRQEPAATAEQQPLRRRRQRSRQAIAQQPEKAPEQAAATAPPASPPAAREPWKYESMRSALGLSFDKR